MSETIRARPWGRLIRDSDLPREVRATAHALATFANDDGTSVYPGEKRLAAAADSSVPTVRRHLAVLKKAGFVDQVRRGTGAANRASEYRLTSPVTAHGRAERDAANSSPVSGEASANSSWVSGAGKSNRSQMTGAESKPLTREYLTAHGRAPTESIQEKEGLSAREGLDDDRQAADWLMREKKMTTNEAATVCRTVRANRSDPIDNLTAYLRAFPDERLRDLARSGATPAQTHTGPTIGPPCGHCDGRPDEPPFTRTLPDGSPCPRCHPKHAGDCRAAS